MKSFNLKNSLILLLTATIWGTAFVAQSVGMDHVGPFTFLAVRSYLGAIVLLPCIWFLNKINPKVEKEQTEEEKKAAKKTLIIGGICCGICLMTASAFQQLGIQYTTVGRAGFLTACYIIIVPIISLIFFKKKCREFYLYVSQMYPESKIFAITPIWRKDMNESRIFGDFRKVEQGIIDATKDIENITVISGFDFVPKEEAYYADLRLHPNDKGFEYYTQNLYNKVEAFCKKG
jgi:uncharacterized membrane protein